MHWLKGEPVFEGKRQHPSQETYPLFIQQKLDPITPFSVFCLFYGDSLSSICELERVVDKEDKQHREEEAIQDELNGV